MRAFVLLVLLTGTAGFAWRAGGPQEVTLEDWKRHVEGLGDGESWWWTSNADYREADGDMEAYGMRYRAFPGGTSGQGCLWGVRGGEVVGPFWYFLMGWDPITHSGFMHQASPGGAMGHGHLLRDTGTESEADQTFLNPDGTTFRVLHRTEMPDPDTQVTHSFDRVEDAWQPRRSYTWERRSGGESICW